MVVADVLGVVVGVLVLIVGAWVLVFGVTGSMLARSRGGSAPLGLCLGIALGPFGWIAIYFLTRNGGSRRIDVNEFLATSDEDW